MRAGQIYNSNYYSLQALLENLGAEVVDCGIVLDTQEGTQQALNDAAGRSDCVISCGGVSVGEEDHVRAAVSALGELSLWKLAIKPGKPFACGTVCGKPFFGLPGNPVSAFVTCLLMVRPWLLKAMGASRVNLREYRLPAGFEAPVSGSRQEYLRVELREDADAASAAVLQPLQNQSSGVVTSLAQADGLAVIPPFTAVTRGDMLRYIPFSECVR